MVLPINMIHNQTIFTSQWMVLIVFIFTFVKKYIMETIFRINASELDGKFLNTLKKLFLKRDIEILITDVVTDETEFLLKDPKNKARLLEAIEEVKQNKNLVRFSDKEFEKYCNNLLEK